MVMHVVRVHLGEQERVDQHRNKNHGEDYGTHM